LTKWKISEASFQSPLHVTLFAESSATDNNDAEEAVRAYLQGLRILDSEQPPEEPPPLFDEHILRSTRHLVSVLRRNTARIIFSSPEFGSITATQRISLNIDELIGVKFKAMGTLEGMLETLSAKGAPKEKLKCSIVDPVTKYRTACYVPLRQLDEAKDAFPMGRVAVYGEIRYGKTGRPLSIDVTDKIRRLRSSSELPQPNDLKGIDITGGVESSEHIRRLRDSD
jgi:hypothetical protein